MEEIKQELKQMVETDQAARSESPIDWDKTTKIDKTNTARLKEIIKEHGWITISKFGEEAAHHAWLLVQHADKEPDFQKECLNIMNVQAEGEVLKKDIALLTDRVLMKTVGVQRYGSQFLMMPTYILVQPVEDPEHLDELRVQMGLKPMKEYLEGHNMPAYFAIRKEIPLN